MILLDKTAKVIWDKLIKKFYDAEDAHISKGVRYILESRLKYGQLCMLEARDVYPWEEKRKW